MTNLPRSLFMQPATEMLLIFRQLFDPIETEYARRVSSSELIRGGSSALHAAFAASLPALRHPTRRRVATHVRRWCCRARSRRPVAALRPISAHACRRALSRHLSRRTSRCVARCDVVRDSPPWPRARGALVPHPLAPDPIVRLILVYRRSRAAHRSDLDLAARCPGVRATQSAARDQSWRRAPSLRTVLDDLIKRGCAPEFLMSRAPAHKPLPPSDGVPVQRCTVHKHRNLFAHAPERLHDEITAITTHDLRDTPEEIGPPQAFIRNGGSSIALSPQPGRGWRTLVHLHSPAAEPMAQCTHHKCNRAFARRI